MSFQRAQIAPVFISKVTHEKAQKEPDPQDAQVLKANCRHCGRHVPRGKWMHEKYCKARPA